MLRIELSKSQFLALAERMANKSLVKVRAFQEAMFIVDENLSIEYMFKGSKSELWDFALELLATSNHIALR